MQNVVSFCHLVQSCSVVFSDVESCSVDFEGSQKCSVDKVKFLLFEENVQSFCHPTEHCPVCASALQMQEREFRHDGEEMESSASISSMNSRERYSGSNEDSSDKINCSSDDHIDRRERGYDVVDGTSSRPNRSSTFLLKSMIIDVTILVADFMFSSPWHSIISLPRAPKTKIQTPKVALPLSQRKCSLDNV